MDHAALVRVLQCLGNLPGHGQSLFRKHGFRGCSGASADVFRQRLALHQLHHQRAQALGFFQAIDGCNVGMVQRGQGAGFTLKARQGLAVMRHGRGQDL